MAVGRLVPQVTRSRNAPYNSVAAGVCPMQVAIRRTASPKLIVFPSRMDIPPPIPPDKPIDDKAAWHNPVRHGNFAQWGAIVVALSIPFILQHCNRAISQGDETFGLRVDKRIEDRLNPAIDKVNSHIDSKIDQLGQKIDGLSDRVSRVEGSLGKRISGVEDRVNQQTSLAKLMDPSRVLATIRAEIQTAKSTGNILPVSDVVDYKNAVRALPPSANEYWQTIAAIINYQSLVNQMSGEAPDPATVSRPCFAVTNTDQIRADENEFVGANFVNCIVDLDTNKFHRTSFKNSVIRYHGSPTTLDNVTFINCLFELDITTHPKSPERSPLLLALLESPDQKIVKVSPTT